MLEIILGCIIILQLLILFRPLKSGGDEVYEQVRAYWYPMMERVIIMSQQLERLHAAVTAQTTVIASVQTLLSSLADRIRTANENDDTDELNTIADEVEQNSSSLAAAVQANTPADPTASGAVPSSGADTSSSDSSSEAGSSGSDPSVQPPADVTSGDTGSDQQPQG